MRAASKREAGQFDDLAALQSGLVCAQTDARPICRLLRIRERIAILGERHRKFIREMRMTPAVPATLREA